MRPETGFWIAPNLSLMRQFADMTSLSNFLDVVNFVFNFSYWFKFHVNILTRFRVQFSFIKDWPGIWKLNMQNSIVIWTFCFGPEIPFWKNLVPKFKIVLLKWNLLLRLIWINWIHWWCLLFSFSTGSTLFG